VKKVLTTTEFVLRETERLKKNDGFGKEVRAVWFHVFGDYAKLMQQPLILSMFVPCSEEGVYADRETMYKNFTTGLQKLDYEAACKQVLFEGWETTKDGKYLIDKSRIYCAEILGNKLIWQYGFRATTVESLARQTDLTPIEAFLTKVGLTK